MFETAKALAAEMLPNWLLTRRKPAQTRDRPDFRAAAMTKSDLIVRKPTSPYRPDQSPNDRASNM